MSKWLGIVCVVACFGMGCGDDDTTPMTDSGPVGMMDGGPVTTDTGPVTMDTGPVTTDTGPVTTDAGPSMCDYDGTYGVEFTSGPDICTSVDIESCTLVTTDGVPTVTCMYNMGEEASGECTYDDACVCTGTTMIEAMMIPVEATIAGDFPMGVLTATALGMDCVFALTMM